MGKYDYSEYKPSSYELYEARHRSKQDLIISFFDNRIRFSPSKNSFTIFVDDGNEYHSMNYSIEEYYSSIGKKIPSSDCDMLEEQQKKNEDIREKLQNKYDVDFEGSDLDVELFMSNEGIDTCEPLINVLSGSHIGMKYGEGILDFIYADFKTPIKKVYQEQQEMNIMMNALLGASDKDDDNEKIKISADDLPDNSSRKIYSEKQRIVENFYNYEATFDELSDILYSSLYTAICPPCFAGDISLKNIKWYSEYILTLQQEYRDLIEFCYDEEFYPDVLGTLTTWERFYLFKRLKKWPSIFERTEQVDISTPYVGVHNPPYSYSIEHIMKKWGPMPVTEQHKELAKKYNTTAEDLAAMASPRCISVKYCFGSTAEILELEFTKMLEENIRFRKCKRCGRYFIMKGNFDTKYCDRIEPGTTRTCQELAAQENYKKKTEDNKALPLYSKYYKRYSARVKVRQIKENDFKKWKYEALTKRDQCTDGIISLEEYEEWLESCFPNRVKKDK